ncbi:type I pullulanase [uncultured Hymenobacter sp.]|uniref:type I pullulanase n=1 Tax=uncultured Hymenobacter sp. TaxID=170016 RepID=UPI0035CBDF61
MNYFFLLLLVFVTASAPAPTPPDFSKYPTYNGPDLGLTFTKAKMRLRVWAPTAEALTLRVYAQGTGGAALASYPMRKAEGGTWTHALPAGTTGFYTVQATIRGKVMGEVADPYAHAIGLNGQRGALLDPAKASPAGWADDFRPALKQPTDVVLGEVHVRDFSQHPLSGIQHKGQYLGFTEGGTRGPGGVSTGLDHLQELGLTHVHLLPTNDFASIDESLPPARRPYNWGYEPLHFSAPEGSFSTDAATPAARLRELKQLVQALHGRGLRIVLDVVYNHTTNDVRFNPFEQLVPDYYYRQDADGKLSNATACGNEVASERPMVRKLIVESVAYWAREYHADGFRFDLMGVLDIETMRAVRVALDQQDHSILMYGEGWAAGPSPLPEARRAVKANMSKLPRIAVFGDELRDGVKGHFADQKQPGFASGHPGLEESVKFGVVGAVSHPQLEYAKVNYSKAPWAGSPAQAISYVASHDDQVLWDKLRASNPGASEAELIKMDLLSAAIVLTSQGIPFLPLGDEFLRTKGGAHNSYNLPDSVNQIDWGRKAKYAEVYTFYRRLIALRRAHPAFRLPTQELVARHLVFLPGLPPGTIAYQLREHAGGDAWQTITVVFNGTKAPAAVPIPAGAYKVVLRENEVKASGLGRLEAGTVPISVPASSALVLAQ